MASNIIVFEDDILTTAEANDIFYDVLTQRFTEKGNTHFIVDVKGTPMIATVKRDGREFNTLFLTVDLYDANGEKIATGKGRVEVWEIRG